MALRGVRRRRAADRGFVLSDHADWEGLNRAIRATGCERVFVTHGYTSVFRRWLEEQGYDAGVVETEFGTDADEAD
jgi:putative mRNA 3-end processing factor